MQVAASTKSMNHLAILTVSDMMGPEGLGDFAEVVRCKELMNNFCVIRDEVQNKMPGDCLRIRARSALTNEGLVEAMGLGSESL